MSLDILLQRLPSHFKNSPESNNYKLLSIIAEQSKNNSEVYDTILRFWDVDQAEGVGLDRLGKDEGLSRGSYDDETYRKLIKIQFIVNMSEGEIESLNAILRAYMGDDFLYLEEGWESFLEEPAALILNVRKNTVSIPFSLIKRIKPAGVAMHYVAGSEPTHIVIGFKSHYFNVRYKITNTFRTAEKPGVLAKSPFNLKERAYSFEVVYPITNTFVTSAINVENSINQVILAEEYRANDILYKRAGIAIAGEGDI